MRDAWRNDRFFQGLQRRFAYALGGPSPRDLLRSTPQAEPPSTERMPLPQATLGVACNDSDANPVELIEHEGRPYAIGVDAEFEHSIQDIVPDQPRRRPSEIEFGWEFGGNPEDEDPNLKLGQQQRSRPPWVAVDLDGTLLEGPPSGGRDRGSARVQLPLGEPQRGAVEFTRELASLGWRISIYTARFGDEDLSDDVIQQWAQEISDHLEQNGIAFTDIWVGRKPRADYFVDDKAIQFDGDFDAILEQLAVETSPPRAPEENGTLMHEGSSPLDYPADPNSFDDPLTEQSGRGMLRPPELEGVLEYRG